MDQLSYIINWIAKDVFGVPAYLVGLMTAIALIASRKSLGDIIGGALKATLGFIILGIGAGAVIGALNPLGALITGSFGVFFALGLFFIVFLWKMLPNTSGRSLEELEEAFAAGDFH